MRVLITILSLTIGAAGCAKKTPESPQPTPVTTAPTPPKTSEPAKPESAPPSTTTDKPAPQAATPPAQKETPAKPAAPEPAKPAASAPAKPATPASPEKPAASAPAKPATPSTPAKPAPSTAATKPATPAPAKPATPPAQTATKPATPPAGGASNPTLDLTTLKDQLKSTKAIGIMTKLSLKNQVDDLLDGFRDHYAGKGKSSMPQLRQTYDLLMMKVLSLLQDKDQKLASDIVASREAIWGLLADPKKFAALDV
jgi:hypothetical protein